MFGWHTHEALSADADERVGLGLCEVKTSTRATVGLSIDNAKAGRTRFPALFTHLFFLDIAYDRNDVPNKSWSMCTQSLECSIEDEHNESTCKAPAGTWRTWDGIGSTCSDFTVCLLRISDASDMRQ